jgi:hypothetical protein
MIRYSRACGSYQDFLDRGLLLTRKLLNQGEIHVYTPYAGATEMLLHINGKFTMGKLKMILNS